LLLKKQGQNAATGFGKWPSKLKQELDNTINTRNELERLENLRPRYYSTNYTDFIFNDYYKSGKRLWEDMMIMSSEKEVLKSWEIIHKINKVCE